MPGASVINTRLWRLMRGNAARQVEMLTAVTPDALIPQGHPMRRNAHGGSGPGPALPTFARRYKRSRLDTAGVESRLLMALYSVSERQCCERLEYDLLFGDR